MSRTRSVLPGPRSMSREKIDQSVELRMPADTLIDANELHLWMKAKKTKHLTLAHHPN